MVDNFSKFIKVFALKDHTVITASFFVYNYCLVSGSPEKIYSDQDPAFEANLFTQSMKQLGTIKSRTSYNSKANGLCEKPNGIVEGFVKYVNLFWTGIGQMVSRTSLFSTHLYIYQPVVIHLLNYCFDEKSEYVQIFYLVLH